MKKLLFLICFVAIVLPAASARVRYINPTATGLNNGTSWANAYTKFDSLAHYVRDTLIQDTFWVANGTYKPPTINGWGIGNSGLKIYGGFAGTETALSQRNWGAFQTILDGDIGVPGVNTDNCNFVVDMGANGGFSIYTPKNPNMRFDGFKIINGYLANYLGPNLNNWAGGGGLRYMPADSDTIEVANCFFSQNTSIWGGAIFFTNGNYISSGSRSLAKITNCRFENNTAWRHGGALATQHASKVLNLTKQAAKLIISDCTFSNNSAAFGGAVANLDSVVDVTLARCTFRGNTASASGGALYDSCISKTTVYNSLIVGNSAPAGCAFQSSAVPTGSAVKPHKLFHCTIANNKSTSTSSSDFAIVLNGKDSIQNCIIWDNITGSGKQIATPTGVNYINTNIIQGGATGTTATYTINPLFTSAGLSSAAPFPITGTYDYRLLVASPAIDIGLTTLVAPAGINATDLDNNNRLYGAAPDLGAYEKTYCTLPAVSVSPSPATICLNSRDSILLTASGGGGSGTYTWIGRGSTGSTLWAKDSGVYQVMSYNSTTGCRSQGSVYVAVVPKNKPVISNISNTLSVPAVYATYQWYKGGVAITGATGASYSPSANGVYTIKVTQRGAECSDTTSYNLTNLGVGTGVASALSIYPNPSADGRFTVSFAAAAASVSLSIANITGQKVFAQAYQQSAKSYSKEIDLSGAAKGVYFLRIEVDGEVITKRLVIE